MKKRTALCIALIPSIWSQQQRPLAEIARENASVILPVPVPAVESSGTLTKGLDLGAVIDAALLGVAEASDRLPETVPMEILTRNSTGVRAVVDAIRAAKGRVTDV